VFTPDPHWPVCVDESGHAAVNLALGVRVKSVVSRPDGTGLCKFPALYAYDDTDRLVLLRHLIGALAGAEAQRAFTQGADVEYASSGDRKAAQDLAMLIAGGEEVEAREVLARAQAQAAELVVVHAEAIHRMARKLYDHRELTGAEVRQLFCSSGIVA